MPMVVAAHRTAVVMAPRHLLRHRAGLTRRLHGGRHRTRCHGMASAGQRGEGCNKECAQNPTHCDLDSPKKKEAMMAGFVTIVL